MPAGKSADKIGFLALTANASSLMPAGKSADKMVMAGGRSQTACGRQRKAVYRTIYDGTKNERKMRKQNAINNKKNAKCNEKYTNAKAIIITQ